MLERIVKTNTIHSADVELMLAHRWRRWPNLKPTLTPLSCVYWGMKM